MKEFLERKVGNLRSSLSARLNADQTQKKDMKTNEEL